MNFYTNTLRDMCKHLEKEENYDNIRNDQGIEMTYKLQMINKEPKSYEIPTDIRTNTLEIRKRQPSFQRND